MNSLRIHLLAIARLQMRRGSLVFQLGRPWRLAGSEGYACPARLRWLQDMDAEAISSFGNSLIVKKG